MVHLTGLEPAHQRYQILNLARLPIPPQVHSKLSLSLCIYFVKQANLNEILIFLFFNTD